LKPVHVVTGGKGFADRPSFDAYLAEQIVEKLLTEAVGTDRGDGLQLFRGDEATWNQVVDAARTRSLFAPRKAILVRHAEGLKGEDDGLAGYLADPTPGVALILVCAKPDKRKSAWKKIFDAAAVSLAEPLKGQALKAYVASELKRRGFALPAEALDELILRVGADLRRLMGEVEKLEAYAEGDRLSAPDVAAVLGKSFGPPLWKLSDAFCEHRVAPTLENLEQALGDGEAPLKLLAVLHRALRQVRAARGLQEERAPRSAMLAALGLHGKMEFKLDGLLKSARAWDEKALARAFASLDRADRALKTSAEPQATLVAAVAEALGRGAATPSPATR
jgi:DNA polymerase III subunit delta